jgi:hypothetical protein
MVQFSHMAQNAGVLAIKYFFGDILVGLLLFPVWWYSSGFAFMLGWVGRSLSSANKWLSLGVWIKNLFVPMYGESGISGRLISFFMRSVIIFGKSFAFLIWTAATLLFFALYLIALPAAVIGIFYHGVGILAI